jgi:hypothetical protein
VQTFHDDCLLWQFLPKSLFRITRGSVGTHELADWWSGACTMNRKYTYSYICSSLLHQQMKIGFSDSLWDPARYASSVLLSHRGSFVGVYCNFVWWGQTNPIAVFWQHSVEFPARMNHFKSSCLTTVLHNKTITRLAAYGLLVITYSQVTITVHGSSKSTDRHITHVAFSVCCIFTRVLP